MTAIAVPPSVEARAGLRATLASGPSTTTSRHRDEPSYRAAVDAAMAALARPDGRTTQWEDQDDRR